MIPLEDVNELKEVRLSYSYVDKKKIWTFLKGRQMIINITCKKTYETALRENPRSVSTQPGSCLPCMAMILNCNRKKIRVDYCVLMRVSVVIVNLMHVQSWKEKRDRQ